MDAIDYLLGQHRETDRLFDDILDAKGGEKYGLFEQLADLLAVHAAVEERIFYPAVKNEQTEDVLKDSVQEHLEMKRRLAELMDFEEEDDAVFDAKIKELMELVQHHVGDEEEELFPKVREIFDDKKLGEMFEAMRDVAEELESEGEPSENIPFETDRPAPI